MQEVDQISDLPETGAIYALYGRVGEKRGKKYIVYIVQSGRLRTRIRQHLVSKDSSVVTQTYAYALLPDQISDINWWEDESFNEEFSRQAAELVAYDALKCILRSRGTVNKKATELYNDKLFYQKMTTFFSLPPTGHLRILNFKDVVLILRSLEARIEKLERKFDKF